MAGARARARGGNEARRGRWGSVRREAGALGRAAELEHRDVEAGGGSFMGASDPGYRPGGPGGCVNLARSRPV